jgi:hypothetical protein
MRLRKRLWEVFYKEQGHTDFVHCPGAISPHMQRSFVDRQYLPSTGMDLSEWEIILDELTRMGYIVKKEPNSDGNE